MNLSLKVGSVLMVPLLSGMTITSSKPQVVTVATAANVATVTAVVVGSCELVLQVAPDLKVSLTVNVVTV